MYLGVLHPLYLYSAAQHVGAQQQFAPSNKVAPAVEHCVVPSSSTVAVVHQLLLLLLLLLLLHCSKCLYMIRMSLSCLVGL
jgi:hypothetical protein